MKLGPSKKKVCFTCKKICFYRLAPSFIQAIRKNSLNACGKQEKTCYKKMSELSQEFHKFLPQASTFFSILEFFYECTAIPVPQYRFFVCFTSLRQIATKDSEKIHVCKQVLKEGACSHQITKNKRK